MTRPFWSLRYKTWLVFGTLPILLALGVSWAFPWLLAHQLPAWFEAATHKKTSLTSVAWSWNPPSLTINGLTLQETSGQAAALLPHLQVEVDALKSLRYSALVIRQIELVQPHVQLSRNRQGEWNWPGTSAEPQSPALPSSAIFPLVIENLALKDAQISLLDQQNGGTFSDTLQALNFSAENFSTLPGQTSRLHLDFAVQSGGHGQWDGSLALAPLVSQGKIQFEHLNLDKWLASCLSNKAIKIGGDNQFTADYQLSANANQLTLNIPKSTATLRELALATPGQSINLKELTQEAALSLTLAADQNWQLDANSIHLQGHHLHASSNNLLGSLPEFTLQTQFQAATETHRPSLKMGPSRFSAQELRLSSHTEPLVYIPEIHAQGLDTDLTNHQLNLDLVSINGANINLTLNADGHVNFPSAPVSSTVGSALPPPPVDAWRVKVGAIALNEASVNFDDHHLQKPANTKFNPISVKLSGYDSTKPTDLALATNIGVNGKGLISADGKVSLQPLGGQLAITVKNIELEKFQHYVDEFVRLDLIDGSFNADGQLSFQLTPGMEPNLQFQGDTSISDFLLRDQRVHKDFLKWRSFSLQDLLIDLPNRQMSANHLTLTQPYARVTIRQDKTVNFSGLLVEHPQPNPAPSGNNPAQIKPLSFELGKINIADGSSNFTDLSLVLPFSAYIKSLDGIATGISSNKNSQIKVSLKGNAYDLAPVDITGEIKPFQGQFDTKINFYGLPMPLISSYMVQFAGYKVEKGKMSLDLHYHVADKKLAASNHFLIDQFELGERIKHPGEISLPMQMAVALLKDSQGKIKLDIPISGDLDNPKFNIGTIVAEALGNALVKIVRSPLTMFSSVMASQTAVSEGVRFNPGSAALEPDQKSKLAAIAELLNQRPQLILEIKGVTQQSQDWPAISDDALYDQLKIRRANEINQKASVKIRPEYVQLAEGEFQRLLADMFIEKFPLLAERSWLGVPRLKNPQAGQQFGDVAKQKLQDIINPEPERLKDLANNRARSIAKHVVQQGKIPNERVYILDSEVNETDKNQPIISLLQLKPK